jgi:predicted MFS family arabinose efflux permease
VLSRTRSYRAGFGILLGSALLTLTVLALARRRYPNPRAFETSHAPQSTRFPRAYWWYVSAGALIGCGFVDFSLIAFHFQGTGTLHDALIPISYAVAMGAGAAANFLLGAWYDRAGFPVLLGSFLVAALFTPLVFFGPAAFAWLGMALWGINKGAQDTLLKPAIAPLIPRTGAAPRSASSIPALGPPG